MFRKMVRPDSKGRITLGRLAAGISGFSVTVDKGNKIILEPYAEIPQKSLCVKNGCLKTKLLLIR